MTEKKGILAVSFGTTHDAAREESIEAIERQWTQIFSEYTVRRAFTSGIVRRKLSERGILVQSVSEALRQFEEDGYTHVWVQPTHFIPGEEYDRLKAEALGFKDRFTFLKIGEPLLVQEEDYDTVVTIMKKQNPVSDDEACIFMGHGTYHEANRVYEKIEKRLEKESGRRYFMATVEGIPSIEDILEQLKAEKSVRRLRLVPFMLVAGEHARNDMAGEEAESWKSICGSRGYEVSCVLHGMGFYEEIRELYVQKCRKCLSGIFYGVSVGPGAGGNLTLDAAKCIRECDVLAVPRTGEQHTIALSIVQKANVQIGEMFGETARDYLRLSKKETVYLDFLMTRDAQKREAVYRKMSEELGGYLAAGKNVGMIVLGDVSVYATVSYLAGPLKRSGYEVTLLPGVNSFCASAAALGRSLTEMSKPLHIIPAGYDGTEESLRLPGSKVLMKSGKNLPETKRLLKDMGLYRQASMVKDCGMETQELCWSLDEDTERNSYFTTILVSDHTKE
ncbi:MAG: sirohydrochlorin cobaltochelatase [Lachnospiraceae bacterium]|nr:sirohydrochlorin cobaltochelatase [Lachnospiraceae bacterium]